MAVQKNITLYNGVETTYHKIDTISIRNDGQLRLDISVVSYVNKEYREKNADITRNFYSFVIEEKDLHGDIFAIAYAYLKTQEQFKNSIDV